MDRFCGACVEQEHDPKLLGHLLSWYPDGRVAERSASSLLQFAFFERIRHQPLTLLTGRMSNGRCAVAAVTAGKLPADLEGAQQAIECGLWYSSLAVTIGVVIVASIRVREGEVLCPIFALPTWEESLV